MDFAFDARTEELRTRLLAFMDEHVYPAEEVAEEQRAGRGRLDRAWTTTPGTSIAASILVPSPASAPPGWVPLVVGLALRDALSGESGLDVVLKWPNDLLVPGDGDRKVAGILAELTPAGVVVGTGINIEASEGAPAAAAENGTVIYVGSGVEGYGNLVLIRHPNGYVSAYAHLSSMNVAKGAVVKRGDTIGAAGKTGSVTQSQLHFELRKGATPVDPMPLLSATLPVTEALAAFDLAGDRSRAMKVQLSF